MIPIGIVASIICLLLFAIHKNAVLLAILFAVIGIALGAAASCSYVAQASHIPENGSYILTLKDDPKPSSTGSYANAEVRLLDGRRILVRAFFDEGVAFLNGARLKAMCAFHETGEDYTQSSYMAGVHMQASVSEMDNFEVPFPYCIVYDIRKAAIDAIAEEAGNQAGILQALLCGYRPTIQTEGIYDAYKYCGVAHMIAVSGAHLSIISMTFAMLLKLFRLPRFLHVSLNVVLIFAYLLFAGVPISALRAAIMCTLGLVCTLTKRRGATLNALSICVICFIVANPVGAVSVSLFLSAASTFAIVSFSNMFGAWATRSNRLLKDYLAAPLALTISSNIATLPFSAALFGIVPIASPIANVVMTPLFTLICSFGVASLAISLLIPAARTLLIGASSALAAPLNSVAQTLSSHLYAYMEVALEPVSMLLLSGAIMVALWFFKPRIKARFIIVPFVALIAFFAITSITIPSYVDNRIVMLDVGQGDAFAIQSRGCTLLIDTGDDDARLKKSLRYAGITQIDAVSISHSDSDHCAAFSCLGPYLNAAKFICPADMVDCDCVKCSTLIAEAIEMCGSDGIEQVGVGDAFNVGDFRIEVLWPSAYTDKGGNSDSVCLLAELDLDDDSIADWRALFTGDAESDELEKILSMRDIGDIDILKVGHHGSRKALTEDIVSSLDPEYALVGVGAGNSYGHPSKEALDCLEDVGSQLYRSDENGVVELRFSAAGVEVLEECSS